MKKINFNRALVAKKKLFLFLLPMLLLAGCKPVEENTPEPAGLSIEPQLITCPATGGDYTIEVNSPDGAWTATASASWIRVMPASGEKGTTEVRVKIDTNKEAEESQGKITFVSGEEKVELPVSRAAKAAPYLRVVSEKALNTPKEGGSYTVQVESNIKWSISSNTGWAKVNKGVTVNNDNITITVDAATTPEETEALIVVKPYGEGYDAGSDTVYITRGSTEATSLTVDPEFIEVPENGGSYTINVSSTAQWRVYKSWDMDWVTFTGTTEGNGSGSFSFSVEAATSMDAVSGILTIEEVRSDHYKPVVTQVAVSRAGKAAASLSVSPTSITAEYTGGSYPIEIKSNYPWTASLVGARIFSVSATSGDGDATMIVTVKPTTEKTEATGSITIRSTFGNEQAKINIRRLGNTLEIKVNVDDLNVPYGGLFQLVKVEHKYSYSVTSSDTTVVKVHKGYNPVTSTEAMYLDVLPSLVRTTSTATVTFRSDWDNSVYKTITVTRAPLPDYIIPGLFEIGQVARYFDYDTHEPVLKPKQVYFSKGNLQYQASTRTWRFAEHQYDVVGTIHSSQEEGATHFGNVKEGTTYSDNALISTTYSGWIDLFGWGTANAPANVTTDVNNYSTFHEWGDKKISNGGNQEKQWRTLTADEWRNLIRRQRSADYFDNRLYTCGDVTGAIAEAGTGLFFYPDGYTGSISSSIISISKSDFLPLENQGVVYLPPTMMRMVGENEEYCRFIHVKPAGGNCYYWSSTADNSGDASYLDGAPSVAWTKKYNGMGVRLVQDTYVK